MFGFAVTGNDRKSPYRQQQIIIGPYPYLKKKKKKIALVIHALNRLDSQ